MNFNSFKYRLNSNSKIKKCNLINVNDQNTNDNVSENEKV